MAVMYVVSITCFENFPAGTSAKSIRVEGYNAPSYVLTSQ
jgi:hypothetical protein